MGNTCNHDIETDIDKLFKKIDELKIDADKGNVESEYKIGNYYYYGLSQDDCTDTVIIIVKQNKVKGMEYLNKAASKGHQKAKNEVDEIIKWDKEREEYIKKSQERNIYRDQISNRVNGR